jgi:hypothetical protein
MNASAAVRGLLQIPFATSSFPESGASESEWHSSAQNIKGILSQAGYTVAQLSASTGMRYGTRSPFFIPPTFLYKLRSGVTPHICQIVALSDCTGYRFVDWMKICGFDLQQIPRLQLRLHSERTVLITPTEFDRSSLRSRPSGFDEESSSSSSFFTASRTESGLHGSAQHDRRRYLLAKVGRKDALVHPQLMPGVIVRADRWFRQRIHGATLASMPELLWLVELPGGLTCCHVRWIDQNQIVLLPSRPPWGKLPLHLSTEARILGLVDAGPGFVKHEALQSRALPVKFESAFSPSHAQEKMRFSDLLRISRRRTGLTFRAAQQLTGAIAQILACRDYAIGLGVLSDYETMSRLPRHIAKIISLCVTYCIDIRELMETVGVKIEDSAKLPLPAYDQAFPRRLKHLDGVEQYRTVAIGAGYEHSAEGRIEGISRI